MRASKTRQGPARAAMVATVRLWLKLREPGLRAAYVLRARAPFVGLLERLCYGARTRVLACLGCSWIQAGNHQYASQPNKEKTPLVWTLACASPPPLPSHRPAPMGWSLVARRAQKRANCPRGGSPPCQGVHCTLYAYTYCVFVAGELSPQHENRAPRLRVLPHDD